MISVPCSQHRGIATLWERGWCCAGMVLLLIGLFPGVAVGQGAGGEAALLTGTIKNPVFCPSNPSLVAYSRQVEDTQELYLYNAKTRGIRQVTAVEKIDNEEPSEGFLGADTDRSLRRFEGQIAWRPLRDPKGRQWFVFMSSASETGYGLFLSYLTPEGKLADRIVELPFDGQATAPTWSPDGRRLAFSGSRVGTKGNNLFMYPDLLPFLQAGKNDTSEVAAPVQLTQNPAGDLYPAWSPTGEHIAYQSKRNGESGRANWGISLLNLSGWKPWSNTTPRSIRLSPQLSAYHEYKPSWSPTGDYVGFYVSQSRIDAGVGNRRQDIGVLELVSGSQDRRVRTGRVLEANTDARLARDVLPSDAQGPEWHPSGEVPAIIYVKKEENKQNPIYLADVKRWRSGSADYARRLSGRFEDKTRLHEEVDAIQGGEGLRLAFASQVGERLQLQLQKGVERSRGGRRARAETARAGAKSDGYCRIQFSAKDEKDENFLDYKRKINESIKIVKAVIETVNGEKSKYKIVSKKKSKSKSRLKRLKKRIEKSNEFKQIKYNKTIIECDFKGKTEL